MQLIGEINRKGYNFMIIRTIVYVVLVLSGLISPLVYAQKKATQPMFAFKSNILPITPTMQKMMRQYTYLPQCPISFHELVIITLSYWGFDHKAHQGVLVVNRSLAREVADIFKAAYYHQFPIERMELMDTFKGDDNASMALNNTSAFNCRVVTGQPGVFSQHSYGRAIDINPLINPYVKGEQVLPLEGKKYADRALPARGKIVKDDFLYNEFTKRGWDWGGNWLDLQDYQHFEKRAHNKKRNINGYPPTQLR